MLVILKSVLRIWDKNLAAARFCWWVQDCWVDIFVDFFLKTGNIFESKIISQKENRVNAFYSWTFQNTKVKRNGSLLQQMQLQVKPIKRSTLKMAKHGEHAFSMAISEMHLKMNDRSKVRVMASVKREQQSDNLLIQKSLMARKFSCILCLVNMFSKIYVALCLPDVFVGQHSRYLLTPLPFEFCAWRPQDNSRVSACSSHWKLSMMQNIRRAPISKNNC